MISTIVLLIVLLGLLFITSTSNFKNFICVETTTTTMQTTTTQMPTTTSTTLPPCANELEPILVRGVIHDMKMTTNKTAPFTDYKFNLTLTNNTTYSVHWRIDAVGINYQDNQLVTVNGTRTIYRNVPCTGKGFDIEGKILTQKEIDAVLRSGIYPIY